MCDSLCFREPLCNSAEMLSGAQWWTEVGVIVMFVANSVRINSIALDELQSEMKEAAKIMRKRKLGDVLTFPKIIQNLQPTQ